MNTNPRLTLEEAKRGLPIVPDLWQRLALPGEVPRIGRKFTSPFRPDHHPSCTVFVGRDGCQHFADHSQGLTVDAIGFLALATGLDKRGACRRFLELAGGGMVAAPALRPVGLSTPRPASTHGRPALPADLHSGSRGELGQLATLRGLSLAGVELASARGLLWFGRACGQPCWIVTDQTRTLAQARRLDGQPFAAFKEVAQRKAHTLKGSRQGWPLGIGEAEKFPTVMLVEGGPDLLAACHFIAQSGRDDFAPVAMLGAANRIPVEVLARFARKRVRIYPHADPAGREAAARWAWEMEIEARADVVVDAYRLDGLFQADGQPVSDLNDLARVPAANQPEGLLP